MRPRRQTRKSSNTAAGTTLCEDILYVVAQYLDDQTLIKLRLVSHAFKDKAEALLVQHIAIRVMPPTRKDAFYKKTELQVVAITGPNCRLPMFFPRTFPVRDSERQEKPRYHRYEVPFSKRKVSASERNSLDINRLVHTEEMWDKLEAARVALSLVEYEVRVADWQFREDQYQKTLDDLDGDREYLRKLLGHCHTVDVYYPVERHHHYDDSGIQGLLPNVRHIRLVQPHDTHHTTIAAPTAVIRVPRNENWVQARLHATTRRVLINPYQGKATEWPDRIYLSSGTFNGRNNREISLDEVVVLIAARTTGLRNILTPVLTGFGDDRPEMTVTLVDIHGSPMAPLKSRPLDPKKMKAALQSALADYIQYSHDKRPEAQLAERLDRVQFRSWGDLSPQDRDLLSGAVEADKIAQPKPPKPRAARKTATSQAAGAKENRAPKGRKRAAPSPTPESSASDDEDEKRSASDSDGPSAKRAKTSCGSATPTARKRRNAA